MAPPDRQGVHVGPDQDASALPGRRPARARTATTPVLAMPVRTSSPALAQHVGDALGGAVLLEGQLGVAVEVAPEVDDELAVGGAEHGRSWAVGRVGVHCADSSGLGGHLSALTGRAACRARARMRGSMDELAFRQVHLDFHTSGEIPGVGADFDPQAFVATLQAGAGQLGHLLRQVPPRLQLLPDRGGGAPSAPRSGTCWGSRWRPATGPGSASRPTSRWSGTSTPRRRTRSGCRSTARAERWGAGPSDVSRLALAVPEHALRRLRRRADGGGAAALRRRRHLLRHRHADRPRAASATPAGRASRSRRADPRTTRPCRGRAWRIARDFMHRMTDAGAPHPPRGQRLLQQPPAR